MLKIQQNLITDLVKGAYQLYAGYPIFAPKRNKNWMPIIPLLPLFCASCLRTFRGWLEGNHKSMPFAISVHCSCKKFSCSWQRHNLQYFQKVTVSWTRRICLVHKLNRVSFLDVLLHFCTLFQVPQKDLSFQSNLIWITL